MIDRVHKRSLGKAAGNVRGQRALDFGSGTGRLSEWLMRHGATVDGVDATAEMVAVAQTNVPQVHFQTIDGFALPFANQHFDLVVTAYVLQYYVERDMRVVHELARVLGPDGRLVAIEQVADDDKIGRGGALRAYEEMFHRAGLRLVDVSRIRLGDSRIVAVAERLPILARLPMVPWLVMVEAQSRKKVPLTGGRYADVVFCATKAQA